jgi:hypothetical protein
MNIFYSVSKTHLKLGRDSSIEFHIFKGAQDVVTRLTAVMLHVTKTKTPTDYPSTTRGMSVGHTVAVNINFCGYLRFF